MVSDPADYTWSSYRAHALGKKAIMWKPHPEYLALGNTSASRLLAYRRLINHGLGQKLISEIRDAAKSGLVLGNENFRKEVELQTGKRQHLLKRGPKNKPRPKEEFLL